MFRSSPPSILKLSALACCHIADSVFSPLNSLASPCKAHTAGQSRRKRGFTFLISPDPSAGEGSRCIPRSRLPLDEYVARTCVGTQRTDRQASVQGRAMSGCLVTFSGTLAERVASLEFAANESLQRFSHNYSLVHEPIAQLSSQAALVFHMPSFFRGSDDRFRSPLPRPSRTCIRALWPETRRRWNIALFPSFCKGRDIRSV